MLLVISCFVTLGFVVVGIPSFVTLVLILPVSLDFLQLVSLLLLLVILLL